MTGERTCMRLAVALSLCVAAGAASAETAVPAETAARILSGPWDAVLKAPLRGCKVELTDKPAAKPPGSFVATIPQRCRWAVPALAKAAAWSLSDRNWPQFVDANGAVVMSFDRAIGPVLTAKIGQSDYSMEASGSGVVADNDRRYAIANLLGGKEPPASRAAVMVDPRQVPGNYGVAREKGRPICSIALSAAAGARGSARVTGGCLDAGLKIFDPVAWRLDKGRLVLIARKGHEAAFMPDGEGAWTKDPPGGSPMFLKRQ